jgi:hypothetical protein
MGFVPFENVRAELESELRAQQSNDNFIQIERALSDALFDAEDIKSLSMDLDLSLMELKTLLVMAVEILGQIKI